MLVSLVRFIVGWLVNERLMMVGLGELVRLVRLIVGLVNGW